MKTAQELMTEYQDMLPFYQKDFIKSIINKTPESEVMEAMGYAAEAKPILNSDDAVETFGSINLLFSLRELDEDALIDFAAEHYSKDVIDKMEPEDVLDRLDIEDIEKYLDKYNDR